MQSAEVLVSHAAIMFYLFLFVIASL